MKNKRAKMSPSERAKQFMPFAALKGLPEALAKKERIIVPKSELSEERSEEIDRMLRQIQKGDIITAVYYSDGEYLKISGIVAKLDTDMHTLRIVNTEINFNDLYDIKQTGG